jgi:hypothetical protein
MADRSLAPTIATTNGSQERRRGTSLAFCLVERGVDEPVVRYRDVNAHQTIGPAFCSRYVSTARASAMSPRPAIEY